MKLLSDYPSYLKSCGNSVKFPVTGRGETLLKREKRTPGELQDSHTSVPGKIVEQILHKLRLVETKEVTGDS